MVWGTLYVYIYTHGDTIYRVLRFLKNIFYWMLTCSIILLEYILTSKTRSTIVLAPNLAQKISLYCVNFSIYSSIFIPLWRFPKIFSGYFILNVCFSLIIFLLKNDIRFCLLQLQCVLCPLIQTFWRIHFLNWINKQN